jgi:glycerophosphoryl diester phosphodiesterase
VYLSRDGQIVVFHDDVVFFEGKSQEISKLSLLEIQTIHLQCGQKIPTLIAVLDLLNKSCIINIELKGKKTAKPVVELILSYIKKYNWSYNHFLVSSFVKINLLEVKGLDSKIRLAILEDADLELAIDFAKYINAYAINPHYKLIDKDQTKCMQEKGFKVFAWTVNAVDDIKKVSNFGVDGIISDYPERI